MNKGLHKGVYVGVRKRLRGSQALVLATKTGVKAQFDEFKHKESHGWWAFREQDFKILYPLTGEGT